MSNSGIPIVEDVAEGVGDVVDVVEEAVNDVGDAISDVGEWLDDEVIQPVAEGVKDVLSNELVVTVASIAASVYAPWAIPLIQGASVAAQGGDIRDVLEASAKAYVASQVGAKVGSSVGSSVTSSTGSQVAGSIIGQGAGSATVAAAMGGDPVQAFITGGAMASVPHIMGQSDYFAGISDKMKDGTASAGEIASYKAAQTLVTSAVTGRDVDENVVAAVAASSYLGGELLKEVDPNNEFTEAESALVMDMVNSSMQAYVTGGNIQDAVMKDIVKYGKKELGTYLKDVKENFTKTGATYDSLTAKANEIQANTAQRTAALEKYQQYENEYNTELALLTEKQQQAQAAYDGVEAGTMTIADAEAIIEDYNDEAALFEARINDYYNPNFESTADEYAQYEEVFADLTEDYDSLMADFQSEADKIDEKLEPAYEKLKESFVQGMDPNFNAEEYAEINSLSEDVDPYEHWLTEGASARLATNYDTAEGLAKGYEYAVDNEKQRIYEEAIEKAGILGKSAVTEDSAKAFFDKLEQQHGNNLDALREVNGATDVAWNQLEELELQTALDNVWDINKLQVATAQQLPQEVLGIMSKYEAGGYSIGEIESELNALGYDIDSKAYEQTSPDADVTITLPDSLDGYVRPIGDATSRGSAVSGRVITDPTTGKVTFASSTKTPDYEMWSADTGATETVEGSFQTVNVREEIKKDPFTWLTSLSQAEEDMRTAIQESTGLDDYFFDVSKNAINIAKNTNNNAPVKQAADIFKTDDVDAIQNYNNIISKDATTWGGAYTPTDEDVVNVLGTIGANPDIDSQTAIQEYVDPRYIDIDEVKEAAAQQGYQISDEEALQYTGQLAESEILPTYQETFDPLATTEEEVRDFFGRYRYDPTDEEVQQFVGSLGEDAQRRAIGAYTIPGFENLVGTQELTNVENNILNKVGEYEQAGLSRDQALEAAIGNVAGDLQTSTDNLLSTLGTTRTDLLGEINAVEGAVGALGTQVGGLETGLGELGTQVGGLGTQVSGLETGLGELGTQVGGIGQGLSGLGQGLTEGISGLTGLIGATTKGLQQQSARNALLSTLLAGGGGGAPAQQQVKSVDPARIGYLYDIGGESIFATPQQQAFYQSPYTRKAANGGMIYNSNDALLRLLGGK